MALPDSGLTGEAAAPDAKLTGEAAAPAKPAGEAAGPAAEHASTAAGPAAETGQVAAPAADKTVKVAAPAARLTGRGAVLGMAVVFTVGLLAASWLDVTVVAGIFFVLGCALAAWFTRPADLLIVVLTPPILFSGALIFAEVVTAQGSLLLSVAAGSVVVLASLAPWLAAGLILTVAIACPRGLLRSIGDLHRDLRASSARRRSSTRRRWSARLRSSARPSSSARPGSPRPGSPRSGPPRPGSPGRPRSPRSATAGRAAPAATRAAGRTASAREPLRRPEHR